MNVFSIIKKPFCICDFYFYFGQSVSLNKNWMNWIYFAWFFTMKCFCNLLVFHHILTWLKLPPESLPDIMEFHLRILFISDCSPETLFFWFHRQIKPRNTLRLGVMRSEVQFEEISRLSQWKSWISKSEELKHFSWG